MLAFYLTQALFTCKVGTVGLQSIKLKAHLQILCDFNCILHFEIYNFVSSPKKEHSDISSCDLYYKHFGIVSDDSSITSK